jgi:hypothetical protein
MDKYMAGKVAMEILGKAMNVTDYPLPEDLRVREGSHPSYGKMVNQAARYRADKLKRIAILNHDVGGSFIGSVIMIVGEDGYDFPFIVVNIAFAPDATGKDRIFVEFESKPLVKDDESTRKYIEPLRAWREALVKIPSEPMSGFGDPGEFVKANLSPIEYIRWVPMEHLDEVMDFFRQFFEIVVDFWRQAEPVPDAARRQQIDDFRQAYNHHILDDDPSGRASIAAYGREQALRYFENVTFL